MSSEKKTTCKDIAALMSEEEKQEHLKLIPLKSAKEYEPEGNICPLMHVFGCKKEGYKRGSMVGHRKDHGQLLTNDMLECGFEGCTETMYRSNQMERHERTHSTQTETWDCCGKEVAASSFKRKDAKNRHKSTCKGQVGKQTSASKSKAKRTTPYDKPSSKRSRKPKQQQQQQQEVAVVVPRSHPMILDHFYEVSSSPSSSPSCSPPYSPPYSPPCSPSYSSPPPSPPPPFLYDPLHDKAGAFDRFFGKLEDSQVRGEDFSLASLDAVLGLVNPGDNQLLPLPLQDVPSYTDVLATEAMLAEPSPWLEVPWLADYSLPAELHSI